jgi:hypothetical protein
MCLLETASGDDSALYARWYAAVSRDRPDVVPSHLQLFPMPNVADVRAHLLGQDVVWVGGGSVANLLAVWRTHRLDEIMAEAWQAGVVLAGVSAGSRGVPAGVQRAVVTGRGLEQAHPGPLAGVGQGDGVVHHRPDPGAEPAVRPVAGAGRQDVQRGAPLVWRRPHRLLPGPMPLEAGVAGAPADRPVHFIGKKLSTNRARTPTCSANPA